MKIERNMENDSRAIRALLASGWRVATVWECALKGRTRPDFSEAMQHLVAWIRSAEKTIDC